MNSNGTVRTKQKIAFDTGGLDAFLHSGDAFGAAIANLDTLNGDTVPDIVVGAPGDDDGGVDAGAAWVLYLSDRGLVITQQKISPLEGDFEGVIRPGDEFGYALANAGDVDRDGISDLLAGAPGDDDGGADSGAAWLLFPGQDGKVDGEQKLSPREGLLGASLAAGDRFGSAVAGIGNLDASRATDLAVGAPFADARGDDLGVDSGSVWILFMDKVDTSTECERNAIFRFLGIVDCS
jgi:hypothetical protein